MKNCLTCKAVNIDQTLFCLTCGGGNLEPVGDAFPWEVGETIPEMAERVGKE